VRTLPIAFKRSALFRVIDRMFPWLTFGQAVFTFLEAKFGERKKPSPIVDP